MGRFSDIIGGTSPSPEESEKEKEVVEVCVDLEELTEESSIDSIDHQKIPDEELPTTSEDALDKNLLFSRKNYLKQFDPPSPSPKELNPGQEIFRHKLLDKPEKSDIFVKKSLRVAKEPEKPRAPIKSDAPKSRMRRKK